MYFEVLRRRVGPENPAAAALLNQPLCSRCSGAGGLCRCPRVGTRVCGHPAPPSPWCKTAGRQQRFPSGVDGAASRAARSSSGAWFGSCRVLPCGTRTALCHRGLGQAVKTPFFSYTPAVGASKRAEPTDTCPCSSVPRGPSALSQRCYGGPSMFVTCHSRMRRCGFGDTA